MEDQADQAAAGAGSEGALPGAVLLACVERSCAAMAAALPGLTELLRVMQDQAGAAAPPALAELGALAALPALSEMPAAELQDLLKTLGELLLRLQDSDMDALQVMSVLQSRYGAILGGRLQALDEALGRLEFDAAIAACRALLKQVQGPA